MLTLIPIYLLQLAFFVGLLVLTVGVWMPERISARRLFPFALGSWVAGILAVYGALLSQGPNWLATPRRTFIFDQPARTAAARQHHKILAPQSADRLPNLFNHQTGPVQMEVAFTLLPEGATRDIKIVHSSNNADLDRTTLLAIAAWKFAPLADPAASLSPETIRVRITNNYSIVSPVGPAVGFIIVAALLWWAAVYFAPVTEDNETKPILPRLILVAGYLGALGWLLAYRISADQNTLNTAMPFKQALVYLAGLALLLVAPRVRAARWRPSPPGGSPLSEIRAQGWHWAILSVFLLLLTALTPLGTSLGTNARLWLKIGAYPFQTIEAVKLMLIAFTASLAYPLCLPTRAVAHQNGMRIARSAAPLERVRGLLLGYLGVLLALAVMTDFGPALLILLFLSVTLFILGEKRLSAVCMVGLLGVLLLMYLVGAPRRWQDRVEICRDPWSIQKTDSRERAGGREQVARAQWMIGSGGFNGLGWGFGHPGDIDAVESDFVLAALAEEIGLRGTIPVLALLLYIPFGCFQLARTRRDSYERIFLVGVGTLLGIQTLMICGGNLRLVPLTGITLPFISYGGASLIINFLTVALAIGIAVTRNSMPRVLPSNGDDPERIQRISTGIRFGFVVIALALAVYQFPFSPLSPERKVLLVAGDAPRENPRLKTGGNLPTQLGDLRDRWNHTLATSTPQGRRYAEMPGGNLPDIERSLAAILHGTPPAASKIPSAAALVSARRGYHVNLTLDPDLQRRAMAILEENHYTGSIVGIEPETGEIRFAVSRSETPDSQTATDYFRKGYAPGSTFKTMVTACGLHSGKLTSRSSFTCTGHYLNIRDFNRGNDGPITLSLALTRSCNNYFAEAAVFLGRETLHNFAVQQAAFERSLPLLPTDLCDSPKYGLSMAPSLLFAGSADTPHALALTGIGQGDVRVTPLYLAIWAAGIANRGVLLQPTLVHSVRDTDNNPLWEHTPTPLATALDPANARRLRDMMENVVLRGTGQAASVRGMRVAGKTGTAQDGREGRTNALFIGFAPADHPRIAIAIVIEGGASGGQVAAPLFRAIMAGSQPTRARTSR